MSDIKETIKDFTTSTNVNRELLMEKLSEFLAVEKGGVKLYRAAIQQVRDADVLNKFNDFYLQTQRHQEILGRVIRELGGDPGYMSHSAKLADEKAESLLRTMGGTNSATPREMELNAIENIVIAETKDHADWELLGRIARRTTDSRLRDSLKPAVDEVEPQEDEHLSWTKQQLARLSLGALSE